MKRAASLVIGLLLLFSPATARTQGPFDHWAAVVVAGDWRAGSGEPTEAFDNARRDVSATLRDLGFPAVRQFSARPGRYPAKTLGRARPRDIQAGLSDLARQSTAGCLVYVSSHGSPDGALVGDDILRPHRLSAMIEEACPSRPSVVVISACFSGVFVEPLRKADRMILTAARGDRASFGCGESDKYPYFDGCFLAEAKTAHDFIALGDAVRACVARMEKETGAKPPSEPQMWVGATLRPLLPLYAFPATP